MIFSLGDPAFRLALYQTADKKCISCKAPIVSYVDMQIDHLIYQTIEADALQGQIADFDLRSDYNVHETYNLAPIHGPCNRSKSNKPLPVTALHAAMLAEAQNRAAEVEKRADTYKTQLSSDLSKALATIDMHRDNPGILEKVRELLVMTSSQDAVTEPILDFSVLPDLKIAIDSAGFVHASSLGDCPNSNCITGDIKWETFPQTTYPFRAGYCDLCGTFAVECPDCKTQTSFDWGDEQKCDGCENKFVRETVGGELWDVIVS